MAEIIPMDGRVTIPEAVRDRLGIMPGSSVEFEVTPDGSVVLTKAAEAAPRPQAASSILAASPVLVRALTNRCSCCVARWKICRGDAG